MWRLLSDCCHLVRSWFQVDRIRIAETEGRLLSLSPGTRVLVRQVLYRVTAVRVLRQPGCSQVVHDLLVDDQPVSLGRQPDQLWVSLPTDGRGSSSGELRTADGRLPIFAEDVVPLSCGSLTASEL